MPFAGGSGTEQDPYIITTVEQLQAMQDDLTAHYALGNDIDASETETWNDGQGFEPIGEGFNPFLGSFDGRDHKILGLTINRPDLTHVGLFGVIRGSKIKNVNMLDINICGHSQVGGLVGNASPATFEKCFVRGTIITPEGHGAGGISGRISAPQGDTSIVRYCGVDVTVQGGHTIGGLAGFCVNVDIANSYSIGTLIARPVSPSRGGLIGELSVNSIVKNCYAAVIVPSGSSTAGGLIGNVREGAEVDSSYWDIEVSGLSMSAAGIGKTTAEMMQRATYVGWDFDEVWYIDEGNDYPRLRWESTGDSGRTKASIIVSAGVHRILYAPLEVTAGSAGPLKAPSIIVAGVHRELRTNLDVISGIQGILEAPIQVEALISSELQAPLTVSAEVSAELRAPLNLDFPILHLHYAPVTVSSDVAGVVRPYPSVVSAGLLNQVLRVPNVVSAGTKGDSEAPLLLVVAPIHKRKHPIVVFPGVRRTSKRPIEFIVLYWYRVPIPPPTYGGDH